MSVNDDARPAFRFVLSYALICGALLLVYFVFAFPYSGLPYRLFVGYLHTVAIGTAAVIRTFDPTVRVLGNDIVGRTSLGIVRGCDGTDVLILFVSAVLASRSWPWRLRLAALAIGGIALSAANVARICSLYFVNLYAPSTMDLWHLEIWPAALVLIAMGLFIVCARRIGAGQSVVPSHDVP